MFTYASYTTKGRVKDINQDSLMIAEASAYGFPALLAAICDGMGGLERGEEASSMMVHRMLEWFREDFPSLAKEGISPESFRRSLLRVIRKACGEISEMAENFGGDCGTTLAGLLLYRNEWYAVNVGDSRIYRKIGVFSQVTKDQTFVQREIDAGRMTVEEAKTHKNRSLLLQCIGASDVVVPEWPSGTYRDGEMFLICSDGFRHILSPEKMTEIILPGTEEEMEKRMEEVAEKSMDAGERDNISAITIVAGR